MSSTVRQELLDKYARVDDPEIEGRRQEILQALLEASPQVKEQLIAQGSLLTARAALHRMLARRQLPLTPEQQARIADCSVPVTLERWLDQAITASSATEALR